MNQSDYIMIMAYLEDVPDPRSQRDRRYEWVFLLTVVCYAMLNSTAGISSHGGDCECAETATANCAQWVHNRPVVAKDQFRMGIT